MACSASKVSADTFFQVAGAAWEYLYPCTQQAIRQTSCTGRMLHDSRITDLVVRLGHSKPDAIDNEHDKDGGQGSAHVHQAVGPTPPPTPTELRAMLAAAVRRGPPLQTLRLRFLEPAGDDGHLPAHEREQQLLAVLEALSGSPVTSLTMSGGVPLSGAIASAVASCLPNLKGLALVFRWEENDLPHGDPNAEPASQYFYGAMQLLTLCGPRLRELGLVGGVRHWPGMTFQALRCCTALTLLEVEAGRLDGDGGQQHGPHLGSFAQEDSILGPISQLTGLRSLYLNTVVDPDRCTVEDLAPYTTSLARLSALTALTRLALHLSQCCQAHGDSWREWLWNGEEEHEAWCELQEEHRTSLLSALRAMPQLQDLDCGMLWLKAAEAATLSALTSMCIAGLLPPPPWGDNSISSSSSSVSGLCSLPPQLAVLTLDSAGLPRALASLQVPTTLTALHLWRLRFGMSDSVADNRLSPETVAAVGPALQLIKTLRTRDPVWGTLAVVADSGDGALLPRAGSTRGHGEWLRHLSGLQEVDMLQLQGLELQSDDVACLADALGHVPALRRRDTYFPIVALPALVKPEALERLELDLSTCTDLTRSALEAALVALCRDAPALRRVACTNCPLLDCQGVQDTVLSWLRSNGKDGIQLTIEAPE